MDRFVISSITLFCCCLLSYCSLVQPTSAGASTGQTWVVCVAGLDWYPYSYGFEAGIYKTCSLLAGKENKNLIIISPDSAAFHVKNAVPGKLVLGELYVTELSANVYDDNVNVTYNSQDMTTDLFYAILSGNKTAVKGIGGEKVVQSGPQDTVILVFINYGDLGVMTLTNEQYLYADKFVPFLEDLKKDNKFKQMLILVDGQNSGSMFDGYLCTDCSIMAMTNSAKQDDLEMCQWNGDVHAYTATCFTLVLTKNLEMIIKRKELEETTIFDIYQDIRMETHFLQSITNLYGDLEIGNMKLSEFL